MNTTQLDDIIFFAIWLEGFLYGKISVQCALAHTLAKEVQLFSGPGLYSGIFAMYLHCSSNKSRTATVVFYALCLLYVLSTATVVGDIINIILQLSNNPICKNIIFYQCSGVLVVHNRFNLKWTYSQYIFVFRLSKPLQLVVVTSSLNVS